MAPIVAERNDFMGIRQIVAERAVIRTDKTGHGNLWRIDGDFFDVASEKPQIAHPDIFPISLQFRPHDSRKYEYNRLAGPRSGLNGTQHGNWVYSGFFERAKLRRPVISRAGDRLNQELTCAGIPEISEMRDVRSLVEDVSRTCPTGHSIEHGIGIHDQIIVLVLIEEGVGHEDPQPFEPIPTLNVSSNDPKIAGSRNVWMIEQRDERRLWNHRFESWNQRWIPTALDHFEGDAFCDLVNWGLTDNRNQSDEAGQH